MSALVLFDGECGLCDRAVRLLAALDRRRRLRFAPLQGEAAAPWRDRARAVPGGAFEWLVLVEEPARGAGARVRLRADAVAGALRTAGGAPAVLGAVLGAVPRGLADAVYLALARRRHRAARSCALAPPADERFLR